MRLSFSRVLGLGMLLLLLLGLLARGGWAQSPAAANAPVQPGSVLFENVRIFDGTSEQLSALANVLVVDNKIEQISTDAIAAPTDREVLRINGDGRVLMPGLIDNHVHIVMEATPMQALVSPDTTIETIFQQAAATANTMLMSGFTSVRDMAGPVFEMKQNIDRDALIGPRIWPSGAMISQTAGHGDFRSLDEIPRTPTTPLSRAEQYGVGAIADGVDEVLRRTREQLMQGASQVKIAAGGGVASAYDPLDASQYTEAEIKAAVDAAANWNTYVAVHAYTPDAVQTSIRAGVKVIEHGQLIDEATARMMAENGTWLSMQAFLDDEDANPYPEGSPNRANQLLVAEGTDRAYELAQQYNLKTAWGTDILYSPEKSARRGALLAKMVRWYTPAEVLRMATHTNAELLALSGPRNPYPGKLGVVEVGALADLLLVNGNPLDDIQLVANPDENFLVIMKDGKIYKNLIR